MMHVNNQQNSVKLTTNPHAKVMLARNEFACQFVFPSSYTFLSFLAVVLLAIYFWVELNYKNLFIIHASLRQKKFFCSKSISQAVEGLIDAK
jgi:hypothetical protein